MATHPRIVPYPNGLRYADDLIGTGSPPNVTRSLLSVFTDVSLARPSIGDTMYLNTAVPDSISYTIPNGTYAGIYFINRNNIKGEVVYNNFTSTGQISLSDFYDYQHWTEDNRFAITFLNNINDNLKLFLRIDPAVANQQLMFDNITPTSLYDPYSGNAINYNSAINSAGPYSAPTINTNWDIQIDVLNVDQTQGAILDIEVTDFHSGTNIATFNTPLDPSIGWNFIDGVSIDYYRVPLFRFTLA
jgi:hypothetical protein